jgi:hypothetical protein
MSALNDLMRAHLTQNGALTRDFIARHVVKTPEPEPHRNSCSDPDPEE